MTEIYELSLKKIGYGSLAKLGMVFGFIFGAMYGFIMAVMGILAGDMLQMIGLLIFAFVLFIGSIIGGAVWGIVVAFVYNLTLFFTGGIDMRFEKK